MAISTSSSTMRLSPAFTTTARRTPSSMSPRSLSHPFSTAIMTNVNQLPKSLTVAATASPKAQCFLSDLFSSFSSIVSPPAGRQLEEVTQTLHVYELNEGDRHSPAFLKLSKNPETCIGDLVSFTNKLYSGDLKSRFGVSAGMIIYIENDPEAGDRYEAIYSFYFGSYGHLSAQGPYFSQKDSELVITGGTGIFEGAHGKAKLSNVIYPLKLYYVFELKGLSGALPKELVGGEPVRPAPDVKPSADVKPLILP